jgi:hypothetical protein
MNDMKQWLKKGDPLAAEPELSAIDAQVMRRRVVSEASRQSNAPAASWPGPFALAVAVAASLAIGVSLGVRRHREPERAAQKAAAQAGTEGVRRQLHFATSGGTRIIWTFNKDWDL